MADLTALTLDDFDSSVIGRDDPVVVDFWAPWCGSCRLLMPTVTSLASELDGELRFAKVDVEAVPELAERLGVMSVPTLIMYRSGEEVTRISGVKGKAALLQLLRSHL